MNRIKHIAAVLLLIGGVAQASEASKATQSAPANLKQERVEFLEDKKLAEIHAAGSVAYKRFFFEFEGNKAKVCKYTPNDKRCVST